MIKKLIPFLSVLFTANIFAADFYVAITSDIYQDSCDDNCSLRGAIEKANNTPGQDRIFLSEGEYLIEIEVPLREEVPILEQISDTPNDKGDFDISDDLEIIGIGPGKSIVNGNRISRVFHIEDGSVTFKNFTIRGGAASGGASYGAGIRNNKELTVSHMEFRDNSAFGWSDTRGGGIVNYGTFYVENSKFIDNGVSNIDDYWAEGGAIYNTSQAYANVRDSVFIRNSAYSEAGRGGAIYNEGKADIRRSLFMANRISDRSYRGGSAVANAESGNIKIVSSSFYANSGGGDYGPGYAIANIAYPNTRSVNQEMNLTNITVMLNKEGGIYSANRIFIKNSLIADNYRNDNNLDRIDLLNCDFNFEDQEEENRYVKQQAVLTNYADNSCNASDEKLAVLGAVLTEVKLIDLSSEHFQSLKLWPSSRAIDQGVGPCPVYDQNGNNAPVDGDGDGVAECDIGATEWQGYR